MLKSYTVLLACVMLLAAAGEGLCASRYQDGFRGVAWDTKKADLPDLGLSKKALKNIYSKGPSAIYIDADRSNLEMNLDGVPLLSIFLRFENMVFYGFDMVFKKSEQPRIKAIVEADMGSPGTPCDDGLCWDQDGLNVTLTDRELMVTHGAGE